MQAEQYLSEQAERFQSDKVAGNATKLLCNLVLYLHRSNCDSHAFSEYLPLYQSIEPQEHIFKFYQGRPMQLQPSASYTNILARWKFHSFM